MYLRIAAKKQMLPLVERVSSLLRRSNNWLPFASTVGISTVAKSPLMNSGTGKNFKIMALQRLSTNATWIYSLNSSSIELRFLDYLCYYFLPKTSSKHAGGCFCMLEFVLRIRVLDSLWCGLIKLDSLNKYDIDWCLFIFTLNELSPEWIRRKTKILLSVSDIPLILEEFTLSLNYQKF